MRYFFLSWAAFRLFLGMIVALVREKEICHKKNTKICFCAVCFKAKIASSSDENFREA